MDDLPFEHLLGLLTQVESELIPLALSERFNQRRDGPNPAEQEAIRRLLDRVRRWETDDQLKIWLHRRASLRSYRALHFAFRSMFSFLANAASSDPAARGLVAEMVACPTPLNIVRLVLRGPIAM
jgi:hypothetical protein